MTKLILETDAGQRTNINVDTKHVSIKFTKGDPFIQDLIFSKKKLKDGFDYELFSIYLFKRPKGNLKMVTAKGMEALINERLEEVRKKTKKPVKKKIKIKGGKK